MRSSKLTSKYQATIPEEIRKSLKLKAGDTILFEVLPGGTIVLKKAKAADKEYLEALAKTLDEWDSKYDEEEFKHLQAL